MRKLISVLLMLALVLSLSAVAFASDANAYVVPEKDKDLEKIKFPDNVSAVKSDWAEPVDPDVILLKALVQIPEELKTAARKQIAALTSGGWAVLCGFGVWTEDAEQTYCTIKLAIDDVPAGAEIFVNGNQIQPATNEKDRGEAGFYYFDVPLETTLEKTVVLIAKRDSSRYSYEPEPYYPSPVSGNP